MQQRLLRLAALTALLLVAGAVVGAARADALVKDPDWWKGSPDRQTTVNRLIYSQSPQSIPTSYDPVREAEEILRSKQRNLAPSNPKSPDIWKSIRTITVRSALSTPLRRIGSVALAEASFGLGWKIGTGINAKFLKIGIPAEAPIAIQTGEQITFREAGSTAPVWYTGPLPEDGWYWSHSAGSNYSWQHTTEYLTDAAPNCYSATPPSGFIVHALQVASSSCGGIPEAGRAVAYKRENALEAPGPIEEYTDQPYSRESPAPDAPSQTTVEQTIDQELARPDNADLRQWLNYQLGSPGETDPISGNVNVPQPASAPGESFDAFTTQLDELGLTNVKFEVLSEPDFDPAYNEGAVVRVSPPPGTAVDAAEQIVVTVNRTGHQQNKGECDRSAKKDVGPAPSGDVMELVHTFSGNDPDLGMTPTSVALRWGYHDFVLDRGWGYSHIEARHGWDQNHDLSDTQTALLDPFPEPDSPGSHRFYFFYLGPNRIACTRRVVARFDVIGDEGVKRGIITSFAHPGWYRKSDFPD